MTKIIEVQPGHKVGLVPRDRLRRKQRCRQLQTLDHLKGLAALPTPPATIDWTKGGALSFPIDGNNQYGDCYYACACHGSNSMTGCATAEDAFDTNAIVQAYLKLSGGDNGLSTDMMMGEWRKGLVGGTHRILDEMAVRPTDQNAVALGVWLFGGGAFTLAIPDRWLARGLLQPGCVWDAGPGVGPDQQNGHAVWITGRNAKGYQLQTWGFSPPVTITPAGVAACDPEFTVVFSPDWFDANGNAPNGLTYDQLAALWVQLGGHTLPPSPFQPPAPVPPPLPPGPVSGGIITALDLANLKVTISQLQAILDEQPSGLRLTFDSRLDAFGTAARQGIPWLLIIQWVEQYGFGAVLQVLGLIRGGAFQNLTLQQVVQWALVALAAVTHGQPLPPLPA